MQSDLVGVVRTAHIAVLIVVGICAVLDLRSRRVPNVVTLPAIALGLALYAVDGGAEGFLFSFVGLALGAGLFFVPYLLGGMGAGDVKLMGAVGALLGWRLTLLALFYTAVAGGALAVLVVVRRKALLGSLAGVGTLLNVAVASKRPPTADNLKGERIAVPYAVPVMVGTILALALGWPFS